MTLKNDGDFEEKITCGLKNDMRNLAYFNQRTWKPQNWNFDGILLSKVENVCAKNLQWIYMYLHWRMIKQFKSNSLVVSKLTWGIWQILSPAHKSLKNLHFNGLLLTKVYNVRAKKGQRNYLSWHWSLMQNSK